MSVSQFGGGGGDAFDSGTNLSGVVAVTVRHAKLVDAIQLHFDDGTQTASLGGRGGLATTWRLPAGHRIVRVDVWSAKYVDEVQFTTDGGYVSPKFGGDGGTRHTCAAAKEAHALVGLFGRAKRWVDALGCRFAPVSTLSGPLETKLQLVWCCDGGSSGSHSIRTVRGPLQAVDMSSTLVKQIKADVGGAFKLFSARLDTATTSTLWSSLLASFEERVQESLTVDLRHPCYIYQVHIAVPTVAHGTLSFVGAQVIRTEPIEESAL
jgi:hypothetical protein